MNFDLHQASGWLSRKNPPVGPSSGSVTAHMTLAAPSSTVRGASGPPISVATQPGQTELTRIREARNSSASMRVSAFRATFETLYAGVPPPITVNEPLSLDTFTIRACLL